MVNINYGVIRDGVKFTGKCADFTHSICIATHFFKEIAKYANPSSIPQSTKRVIKVWNIMISSSSKT